MMLDVGPVAPASALVWIDWAHRILRQLRDEPVSAVSLPVPMLDHIDVYLDEWERTIVDDGTTFRWHAEMEPDELEYLTNAVYSVETQLSALRWPGEGTPAEGRDFYLVLVRALLHALTLESPPRAAFANQLRSSWHSSAEAE